TTAAEIANSSRRRDVWLLVWRCMGVALGGADGFLSGGSFGGVAVSAEVEEEEVVVVVVVEEEEERRLARISEYAAFTSARRRSGSSLNAGSSSAVRSGCNMTTSMR